jgi:hypothetical protein
MSCGDFEIRNNRETPPRKNGRIGKEPTQTQTYIQQSIKHYNQRLIAIQPNIG